jgi:hypothetical protein
MTGEDPVDPGEYLLHRVHPNNFDETQPTPILRCEFEPKPRDTDGISFYRETITSAADLANAGKTPGIYYVARVKVADLLALGLTVVPTAGTLPGHVSVPELSFQQFRKDKSASKDLQRVLAVLASQDIVLRPPKADA